MRATAAFIRLFIRGLAWDSQASGVPFRGTLQAASQARITETARGKVLIGTATNGTAVTYALPPVGDIASQDIAEICGNLFDQIDSIEAIAVPANDDTLVVELLRLNPTIRTMRPDFSVDCR